MQIKSQIDSEEFLHLELLVLVLLVLLIVFAVFPVTVTALDNSNVTWLAIDHTLRLLSILLLRHAWLSILLHAWLPILLLRHAWLSILLLLLRLPILLLLLRLLHAWLLLLLLLLLLRLLHAWLSVLLLRLLHTWLLLHAWLSILLLHSLGRHAIRLLHLLRRHSHTRLHHAWLSILLLRRHSHSGLHHAWLHHAGLHHTRLHHTRLHHLLLLLLRRLGGGSGSASTRSTRRLPDGLEVDLASDLALPLNLEPLCEASTYAKGGQLDGGLTNFVVATDILIEHFNGQVVANVLHINVEGLVPDGGLASTVLHCCLEHLLTSRDLHVRVHFTEGLGVACETGLDDGEGQSSCGCHIYPNLFLISPG